MLIVCRQLHNKLKEKTHTYIEEVIRFCFAFAFPSVFKWDKGKNEQKRALKAL